MHGFSLFSWRGDQWSTFASDSGKPRQNTRNASKYLRSLSYNFYLFLQEILQRRENAETWNQKMGARDCELVARNSERTIKLMQNKHLINRQRTLMIYYKDMAKGLSEELYTTQPHRRLIAAQRHNLQRRQPQLKEQCKIVNCFRLNASLRFPKSTLKQNIKVWTGLENHQRVQTNIPCKIRDQDKVDHFLINIV